MASEGDASLQLEEALSQTGVTALMVAYERALETEREDALFKDPLAKQLAGESAGEQMSQKMELHAPAFGFADWPQYHKQWTVCRTAFIDNWFKQNVEPGIQVVNLGAGVDTRPFRLPCLKDVSCVFEVDRTAKIEFTRINTAPANLNRRMSRSHGDLSQQFKALKGK